MEKLIRNIVAWFKRRRKKKPTPKPPTPKPPPAPVYRVHFVYLLPSDKPTSLIEPTAAALTVAAYSLRGWYMKQLGTGKSFRFNVVSWITSHDSLWYGTSRNGADDSLWYWNNVLDDAAKFNIGFGQPCDDYVIYIEAPSGAGQHTGGAVVGNSGIAVLGAKDCAAIRGEDPDWSLSRAIGGCGHEFGHTLGLYHPLDTDPLWDTAIMGMGYTTYPNAVLTPVDKKILNANPFMTI